MTKLKNAKNSKLKPENADWVNETKKEKVIRQIKHKEFPRSYRFSPCVMNAIKDSLERINSKLCNKKANEAQFVKSLILAATHMETESLVDALKQGAIDEIW